MYMCVLRGDRDRDLGRVGSEKVSESVLSIEYLGGRQLSEGRMEKGSVHVSYSHVYHI